MVLYFREDSCRGNIRKTLQKMFACRRPKQRFETNGNWCQLYFELKKLKRMDLVDILQNEVKGEGLHHVLEVHGGDQTQVQLDCPSKQINIKILVNICDELQKFEKLLIAAAEFAHEVIIFHSLGKHFKNIRMLISDRATCDTVIVCEPMTRYFEINRNVSIYLLENVVESIKQETLQDRNFELELLRFSNSDLNDDHVIPLQNLMRYTKKLDLNGNGNLSPQAYHILSVSMMISKPLKLTHLNLSNCNLSDAHMTSLQYILARVEELDLSYNEDMEPRVMKIIADSIIECIQLGEPYLKKLILAGCNITAEHVKQLYRCISLVEHLDLSVNNKLSAYAMTIISDAIRAQLNNPEAKALTLRLEYCQLTDSHIENLCSCLRFLKELDLSWNELSVESIESITETLHESKGESRLQTLKLMGCELNEKHLVEIASTVVHLESLNIGYNQLLCSDCIKLSSEHVYTARKRGQWCYFRSLHIGGLEITDTNTCEFVNMGKSSMDMLGLNFSSNGRSRRGKTLDFLSSIEELNLCGNSKFSPYSAKILSDTIVKMNDLKVDCFLRKLNLSNCNLQDAHIDNIMSCLVYLISLDISSNPSLSPEGMKFIADCVIEEGDDLLLQYLNIGSCALSDYHLKGLEGCYTNIKTVDMSKNKLTADSIQVILKSIDKASKCDGKIRLENLNVAQAFSVRDYCYRKFEINARLYNVNIISVSL